MATAAALAKAMTESVKVRKLINNVQRAGLVGLHIYSDEIRALGLEIYELVDPPLNMGSECPRCGGTGFLRSFTVDADSTPKSWPWFKPCVLHNFFSVYYREVLIGHLSL